MRRCFFAVIISALIIPLRVSAFDCQNHIGTCTVPQGSAIRTQTNSTCYGIKPGSTEMKCTDLDRIKIATKDLPNGKKLFYSSVFQCDSKGEVKMNNGNFNRHRTFHGDFNMLGGIVTSQFFCVTNCCYSFDDKAVLVGEVNSDKNCRNFCCPTYEGYVAGDCSIGAGNVSGGGKNPPASGPGDIINPGDVELFPDAAANRKTKPVSVPQRPNLGGMDFNF